MSNVSLFDNPQATISANNWTVQLVQKKIIMKKQKSQSEIAKKWYRYDVLLRSVMDIVEL